MLVIVIDRVLGLQLLDQVVMWKRRMKRSVLIEAFANTI
jgi:hypothetical protein